MRSAKLAARAALLSFLTPILILTGLSPATGAQETEIRARLRLISIPAAHDLDDDLDVRVRVVNDGIQALEGFRITVGAGPAITTRSELESTFEGTQLLQSFTLDFLDVSIPPGGSRAVDLDRPLAEATTVEGVHPLSLSLLSADDPFTPLATLSTQLMVYASLPPEPLNLTTVVPLNEIPARDPSGAYIDDGSGRSWLEAAVARGGWLRTMVSSLERATATAGARGGQGEIRRPPLRIGFAPAPRLVEEVAGLSDGFVRSSDGTEIPEGSDEATAASEVLEELRKIAGRKTVQPLLVPYSYPDLPALVDELSPGDVGVQLTEGLTILGEVLDVRLDRGWVFPPSGRLDVASLQALQAVGVDQGVFFGTDALEPPEDELAPGCPIETLSFVCPVRVQTDVGAIDGFVADAGLQTRLDDLAQPEADAVQIQRVLAETAMIHAEQPGAPNRILQITVPTAWHPSPAAARALFDGLRDAPWLRSVTPEKGLARGEARERTVVTDAVPPEGLPDDGYFAAIGDAEAAVQSYSTFLGTDEPRVALQRLRRNVLVAEGRTLWGAGETELAAEYAAAAEAEAVGEMRKVTLSVPSQTTFTSRTGTLDILLDNGTGYPVEVRVVLRALDMSFQPAEFDQTFEPGRERLSVQAEAQTSGTFPIEVRIETSDGYTIASESMQVRSTEFNVVALAITLGAVAFLIIFYVVKVMRRRKTRNEPAEAGVD